jgi:phospholipase/carboxylesterase
MVPPESLPIAAEALEQAGFDVSSYVMRGTGHGIAPDGLGVAMGWLRERLGVA